MFSHIFFVFSLFLYHALILYIKMFSFSNGSELQNRVGTEFNDRWCAVQRCTFFIDC